MIRAIRMPKMGAMMEGGRIHKARITAGQVLAPRATLFEVRVDLGVAADQDCPPVFYFAQYSSEKGVIRAVEAVEGTYYPVGEILALAADDEHESVGPPHRDLRTACAGIQVDFLDDL